MKKSTVIVCRPFIPNTITDILDCHFYFVDSQYYDPISIVEVLRFYSKIYIEESIFKVYENDLNVIIDRIEIINDILGDKSGESKVKAAFLASSDTHVHFMQKIKCFFEDYLFIIPDRKNKNESAAEALETFGDRYIELSYCASECDELIQFSPQFVFCSADWTSEFLALQRVIKDTRIITIALQEGPEDWHFKFWQKGELKYSNFYRNADIILGTGAKTFNYIRPKYFSVTGNPKITKYERMDMPNKPKVFINCNFTYVLTKPSYESKRNEWMMAVLEACKECGIDYIISKHPRDDSKWENEPVINSNSFLVKDQILECTICISRFSSILYEAANMGRQCIYFNPHLEPMPIFQDDKMLPIKAIYDKASLVQILKNHIKTFNDYTISEYEKELLKVHNCLLDGNASQRIASLIKQIAQNNCDNSIETFIPVLGRQTKRTPEKDILLNWEDNYAIFAIFMDDELHALLQYAIELIEKEKHVFFIISDFFKLEDFLEYEYYQNIEFILSRNCIINLDGIKVPNVVVTKRIYEDKEIMKQICDNFERTDLNIIKVDPNDNC